MRRVTLAVTAITAATVAITSCSSTARPTPVTSSGQHNAAYDTGQQILAWYDATGTADSAKFATDAATIAKDGLAGDTTFLGIDCLTMKMAVSTAQLHPPLPDAAGQQHWSRALDLYIAGATDCISGASTRDPAAIDHATAELKQGAQEINALNARVAEVTAAAK